jgi:putative photosynthetic complex assembly protein
MAHRLLDIDWETAETAPMEALVNSLSMALPFEPAEKQALLEAMGLMSRAEALTDTTAAEELADRVDAHHELEHTAEVLGRFGQGEGGFVRASVRSLVHQRKIRGEGPAVAFELTEWSNGDLTLHDPVTGQNIETAAFGQPNRAVFADMLPARDAR